MHEARVGIRVCESDARILKAGDCNFVDFPWRLNGVDAEFRIYFKMAQRIDIAAIELLRVDNRKPTPQESTELQEEFLVQLDKHEVWSEVARSLTDAQVDGEP